MIPDYAIYSIYWNGANQTSTRPDTGINCDRTQQTSGKSKPVDVGREHERNKDKREEDGKAALCLVYRDPGDRDCAHHDLAQHMARDRDLAWTCTFTTDLHLLYTIYMHPSPASLRDWCFSGSDPKC